MLLELYAAHESGRKVSVSSLCYASGVPPTTALRQLARLEKFGLILREGDRRDSRRQFIVPTAKAIQGVSDAVAQLLHYSQILDAGAGEQDADPRGAD
jgi:DNA-binding MarR family transcriptional regulator